MTLYKTSTFSPRNCSQLHPCARRPDVVLFPPSLHTSGSKAALNEEKKHHKREIENTRRRTRCLTHTLYIYHATTEKAMTLFVASCPSMRHLLLTSSRTKTGLCNILFPPFPRTKRGRRLDRQPNFAFNAYEPKEKEGFPLHILRRRRRVMATKASRSEHGIPGVAYGKSCKTVESLRDVFKLPLPYWYSVVHEVLQRRPLQPVAVHPSHKANQTRGKTRTCRTEGPKPACHVHWHHRPLTRTHFSTNKAGWKQDVQSSP